MPQKAAEKGGDMKTRKLSAFALLAFFCLAGEAAELFKGRISEWKPVAGGKVYRFAPPEASYAEGGELTFEFSVGWSGVVQKRPEYPWSGVMVTCVAIDPQGRKLHPITCNLGWGDRKRDTWAFRGVIPPGSTGLTLEIGAKSADGTVEFGDASVTVVPCDPAKRISSFRFYEWNRKPVDLDFVNWYGDPGRQRPDIGGNSFAFFRIDEPGTTFDRFPPPAEDLCGTFRLQVTPGEVRDLFFGVYAGADVKSLRAETGKFETRGICGLFRRRLAAEVSLSRVKNWEQCGDMGLRRSYTVMPDPILPWKQSGENMDAGTTAQAMLQFRVCDDAKAGIYTGEVAFRSGDGRMRSAKIELEVLPFRLEHPSPGKYELIAHVGQYGEKAENLEKMAREFKRRGFESMLIATHYGTGRMKFRIGANGKLEIESFDRLRFAVRAYRAAGMTGTFFVHLSDKLEVAVAKAIGIEVSDAHGEQTNMIAEFETEGFKRRIGEALAAIKAECEGIPLAVLAMDEPNVDKRVPRARYEIERIRENGIPAVIYGDIGSYRNVKPDYIICSGTPESDLFAGMAADIASRPGARMYLYEGSGSYHYAFGSMYVGRFVHGWGDYLAGSSGHTAWNFLANSPTDFEGRKHFSNWVCLNHFDAQMNLRWTLGFEAICEGYLDRLYINTLESKLKEKAGCAAASRIAAEFEKLKKSCRSRGSYRDPIRTTVKPAPKGRRIFSNSEMDGVRGKIAGWIKELM
jgi:hypothetical protein